MNLVVAAWAVPAFLANPITIVILILILLIIGYYALKNWLQGPTNTIGISNVVLSITPATLPAGSPQRFNATVTVMGYSDTPVPRDFVLQLYDHDPFNSDLLDEYKSGSGTGVGGLAMTPTGSTALFSWEVTHTFQLWCNSSCDVEGPMGTSGESDPKIFARFNIKYGTPEPSMDSTRTTITCTPVGQ